MALKRPHEDDIYFGAYPGVAARGKSSCLSDCDGPTRKKRKSTEGSAPKSGLASVHSWISGLPESPQAFEDMANAPSKRSWSESEADETGSQTTVSRETKNSTYRDPRYPAIMAERGSYMRESSNGLPSNQRDLYNKLLTETVTTPDDPLFELQSPRLRALLKSQSELRVCIELHPRLVPSAELLALQHPGYPFDKLVEGYNDQWLDAVPFYSKLPQPDHTVAYRRSVFSDLELQKLDFLPQSFLFRTRPGMMFPFLTSEAKCGKEALDTADHANTNSMTVALRAIVHLYRQAGKTTAVHRKTLGFSISHDDSTVRIYGHYPEIDGDKTNYFRSDIKQFCYASSDGQERWTSYSFVWNVYTQFATQHLKDIQEAIRCLKEPQRSVSSHTLVPASNLSESEKGASKGQRRPRRNIAVLVEQLEQQQRRAGELQMQLSEQQRRADEREREFQKQLSEQQERADKQHTELMSLLRDQMASGLRREDH